MMHTVRNTAEISTVPSAYSIWPGFLSEGYAVKIETVLGLQLLLCSCKGREDMAKAE